jgi:hypothetical protein
MKLLSWLSVGCLLAGALLVGETRAPAQKGGGAPGEKFTPPARGERLPDRLNAGDPAPDFSLPDPSGKKEVRLSSFQGKKPVVLIFGSCT